MNKSTALKAAAASAVLAGSLAIGAPAASAAGCPEGQVKTSMGCGKTSKGTNSISSVTPAVGVDFRDASGNRTSSGLSNSDQFEWLGGKMTGKGDDGMLIEVRQVTHDMGGWGPLYQGWIPVKYTQLPGMWS
ncbi:hypothetical protein [Streptomyces cucumeris]|uniref:hypothetical protein n=1 Tax=Streptomyces cucumeris TaxID=2962890 RepID=UPI0020C8A0F9|nr:hypothetical protein [Streptomyces sp. NEAU-Y11]MCP9209510.1 hypothetical protein [Streptomyces sp. NEAU-Y11]